MACREFPVLAVSPLPVCHSRGGTCFLRRHDPTRKKINPAATVNGFHDVFTPPSFLSYGFDAQAFLL